MSRAAGWRRGGVAALTLGLALFGALAIRAAALSGPALNAGLRDTGPWGDWRGASSIALYYENLYLREQAHVWLERAAATQDVGAAAEARDRLRRALALAPANAFAWTELAWAEVALSAARPARRALAASWRTAPYSADLAVSRLALAATLRLFADPRAAPSIVRDLQVARRAAPGSYKALLGNVPGLSELAAINGLDAPPPR